MSSYIAYVEDDEEDIEIFKDLYCTQSQVPVKYFPDGERLKQHLQETQSLPCLFLLDMANPIQPGEETLAFLSADVRFRDIPVILFSTSIKSIRLPGYNNMDIAVLEKPSSVPEWEHACTVINETCRRGTGKLTSSK